MYKIINDIKFDLNRRTLLFIIIIFGHVSNAKLRPCIMCLCLTDVDNNFILLLLLLLYKALKLNYT